MISVSKEKSVISFKLEDGKVCKYDLKDNSCTSPSGNKVKSLQKYFANRNAHTIIENIKEEPYKKWFQLVKDQAEGGYYFSNMGTVLKHLKDYQSAEQLFSAGVKDIHWASIYDKNIPKRVVKYVREHDLKLGGRILESILEYGEETTTRLYESGYLDDFGRSLLEFTKENPKFRVNDILDYFERLKFSEGITPCWRFFTEYVDYVNQASFLRAKFVKYPKNFLTTKGIIDKQYRDNKHKVDEVKFSKISAANEKLNKTVGNYVFIYPKKGVEIQQEGKDQQHCVASYVNYVMKGDRHIIFMRDKDSPDKSLVTVCLDNKLTLNHAAGKFNRELDAEEESVLDKYLRGIK